MAELNIEQKPDRVDPVTVASTATIRTSQTPDVNGMTGAANNPAHDALVNGAPHSHPPAYIAEALNDAERLLKYTVDKGIHIDDDIRDSILRARLTVSGGWNQETAANLLIALTKLAALAKPVTAKSLKWCGDTRLTMSTPFWVAICLAIIIVPFSVVSFVASAISSAIRTDIAAGNEFAVQLRVQLGPLPAAPQNSLSTGESSASVSSTSTPSQLANNSNDVVITELQQFAATIRAVDARTRQLKLFVINDIYDPFASDRKNPDKIRQIFQLPDGLPDVAQAASSLTSNFKKVRSFADSALDDVSFYYGAITTCILPVLYALLGMCAYLLRTFEQQIRTLTFIPSKANFASFLIAGIGGAVVGLFNNFSITQGASIPPLAIAFLVGYAVDVFFAFLEGMLQSFNKNGIVSSQTPLPEGKA
jgi:hypothetical protein